MSHERSHEKLHTVVTTLYECRKLVEMIHQQLKQLLHEWKHECKHTQYAELSNDQREFVDMLQHQLDIAKEALQIETSRQENAAQAAQ